MGYEALLAYDYTFKFQDKVLDKVGQPCSIWVPKQQITLGYEDLGSWIEQWTGVKDISNTFTPSTSSVWIEFQVKRGVFYHFNLDPNAEENKDLVMAFFPTNLLLREGSFIRTAVPAGASCWGDLIFSVVKPIDEGQFKTLKRTFFLRPVVSAELNRLLDPARIPA